MAKVKTVAAVPTTISDNGFVKVVFIHLAKPGTEKTISVDHAKILEAKGIIKIKE